MGRQTQLDKAIANLREDILTKRAQALNTTRMYETEIATLDHAIKQLEAQQRTKAKTKSKPNTAAPKEGTGPS